MRVLVPALLLLTAGCLTSITPSPEGAASASARTIPWELNECRYLVGWSEADPAIIQRHLPEGFVVQAGAPLGLPVPAGPAARSIIGTEAFDCASGSGLNGTVAPMLYGSIWIPVTPPEALAVDGISEVYYKIHVLVPDAARREAMLAQGLLVGDGAIEWSAPTAPTGSAASTTIDGAGAFRLDMAPVQSRAPGETSEFMEITPSGEDGAGGYAIWRANYSWDSDTITQGRGTVDWPADHWVTEAIGNARAPASFHAGVWSFAGTLTLPSR
ncbi:MAG TPA: hypothetical protein VM370_09470 [Candidatus Thermoplasmatota archaeon]|nr:hypothetical protein [Candidatus Thermoplasmatota archaeon]